MAHWLASRRGRLALWFASFAGLAVLEAVQMYAGQQLDDFSITWVLAFRRAFEAWAPCSVLGLGVLWLADRFPFDRERPGRWVMRHLGLSTGYVLLVSVLHAALLHGQQSVRGYEFQFVTVMKKMLLFYSVSNMGFYWLLLLGHHGWRYYQRFREREKRAAELEGQLAKARLDALRMQLNPHFLFNTLNTVAALVHEQPPTAERMVTRLSELLRASLDHSDTQEVPLRDELDLLGRYLEIEQTRFSDRLQVAVSAPAEVQEALVPSLILQPLAENAVRHGIEELEGPGRIEIEAARVGDQLRLVVRDNGPGPENGSGWNRRGGIGLANTRSRLQHLYGETHRMELRLGPAGGAEVILTLPFRSRHSAMEPTLNPGPAVSPFAP